MDFLQGPPHPESPEGHRARLRNMERRLRSLLDNPPSVHFVVDDALRFAIECILRDEEPTAWPRA